MAIRLLSGIFWLIWLIWPDSAAAQWQSVLSGSSKWPTTIFPTPGGVWAGLTQEPITGLFPYNLAFSADDGQNWSFIGLPSGYADSPAWTMTQLNGCLLATSSQGLHTSEDNGRTWRTLQSVFPFNSLRQLIVGGQRLFAAKTDSDGAVLVSADGGQSWQTNPVRDLKGIAYRNDSLYACTYSTVLVSTNEGQSWTKLLDNVYDLQQIAVTHTGSLLITSSRDGLYQSDPAHQKWEKVSLTTRTGAPDSPSTRLLAVNQRAWLVTTEATQNVYASTDQGKTWFDISVGLPTDRRRYNYTLTGLSVSDRSVYVLFGPSVWRRALSELRTDYIEFPDSLMATTTPRDQTLLRWRDNTPNETGFRLERSVGETGTFVEVAALHANTTQYIDTAVANGQTYRYRLRTVVLNQLSGYSPAVTVVRPERSCQSSNRVLGINFSDVQMVTPSRGYILEESYAGVNQQQLLETLDSGRSWQPIMPRLGTANFTSVVFNGPSRGFVVSGYGNLLQTRDEGKSWRQVLVANTYLSAPQFVDEQTGFVTGQNGQFYTTTDGGNTWAGQPSRLIESTSIWFISRRVGYATANNAILRTNDAGYSWVPVLTDNQPYARIGKVWFRNESIGFAIGTGGVYKTTNGGETWTRLSVSKRPIQLMDIKQNNSQHLFVSGLYPGSNQSIGEGSFLYRSVDDGVTWDSVAVPARGVFTRIAFFGQTGCLIGPQRSIAMSYDGGFTWLPVSYNPQAVRVVSRINRSIVSASRSGAKAVVLWSRDGGESWRNYEIAQPQVLNGTIYAKQLTLQKAIVVTEYQISTTNDGGRTWLSRPAALPGQQLYNLVIINENVMYGVYPRNGQGLQLVKTTDGGRTWNNLLPPFNPSTSLSFVDEYTGLIGSDYVGEAYKTMDGGHSWQKIRVAANGQPIQPANLQLVSSSVAYAWESELLYKTVDGGQTWQSVDLSSTRLPGSFSQFINGCQFSNEAVGYLHRNGRLYKTVTGGQAWQLMGALPADNGFGQITADDEYILLSNNYYGEIGKVLLRPTPVMPHEPIGKSVGCLGVQQTYQITNQDAYSYEWHLRGGGQLTTNRSLATVAVTTPGTYTLTVRSIDECGTSEVNLVELPVRVRPAIPAWEKQTLTPCPGTPASYSVRPAGSLSYDWRIGDSLLTDIRINAVDLIWSLPGGRSYALSVQANDGFCTSDPMSSTVVVKALPDKPRIQLVGAGEFHADQSGTIQWIFRGKPIEGATSQTYVANQGTGFYAVRSVNECGYTQSDSLFLVITALEEGLFKQITVYPNPAYLSVHLSGPYLSNQPIPLRITTQSGQRILSRTIIPKGGTIQEEIDVSQLQAGIYIIVIGDDKQPSVYKIVKH